MAKLVDMIRSVPETAVRIFLGATVTRTNGVYVIDLDGRQHNAAPDVYEAAVGVERGLRVRERKVEYASDVLELRHDAEDIYLDQLSGMDLPKALFVPAGEMASSYYRARIPCDLIGENGHAIAQFSDRIDLGKAARYDILWVQLIVAPVLLSIVRAAKAAGIKIVYDVDDRFDAVPEDNPAAAIYVHEKQEMIWEMIGLADVVTVSTNALAAHLRKRAKDVRVLPNLVPASISPDAEPPKREVFRILWAGSPTHKRDLAIVAPALAGMLADHKGGVRFTCFGDRTPGGLEGVRDYVDTIPFVDFPDYIMTLAGVGADIAIAPLDANEFNASKSDVKFLEYSSCGYPSLLSPVGQYAETEKLGAPVSIVQNDRWRDSLELCYNFKDELPAQGKAARKWVIENRCVVKTQARPWLEVIRDLGRK